MERKPDDKKLESRDSLAVGAREVGSPGCPLSTINGSRTWKLPRNLRRLDLAVDHSGIALDRKRQLAAEGLKVLDLNYVEVARNKVQAGLKVREDDSHTGAMPVPKMLFTGSGVGLGTGSGVGEGSGEVGSPGAWALSCSASHLAFSAARKSRAAFPCKMVNPLGGSG